MKTSTLLLLFCCISLFAFSQSDEWITYYESSNYLETPRYNETIEYCLKLDEASDMISYVSFGKSPQGRDLPLLIIDKNGNFEPSADRPNEKLVILIQAGMHAGEIDGKDAGLMFIRDLVIHNMYPELLDHLTLLFIPIFNVDGHERFGPYNRINQNGPKEMGWRTNAQNLNLNRDYLKADTPEMQAFLKLFQKWLPDFYIDIHATDGADYQYVSTYGLEVFGTMDPDLTVWTKEVYIPTFEKEMNEAGYPVFPYVAFRRWHDPRSGLHSIPGTPRYSLGYSLVQNRICLLVENHMLKDYKTRVSATYELLKITGNILIDQQDILRTHNRNADRIATSEAFRSQPFPVEFKTLGDSVMVEFKGVEYDIVTSDLTGGPWFQYHTDKPKTFLLPFFNQHEPAKFVDLPEAYIIPPEWEAVIERLSWHGIEFIRLDNPTKVQVNSYRFNNPSWGRTPYEGRFTVDFDYEIFEEEKMFPAGSVIVPMNQRTSRVITHIFEPDAPDSYVRWGFFNAIFERKEYAETYVMEKMAREMISKNPGLKKDFENWKAENPGVADNQWAQTNWFFQQTPYGDWKMNVYPVGKIMEKKELEKIKGK